MQRTRAIPYYSNNLTFSTFFAVDWPCSICCNYSIINKIFLKLYKKVKQSLDRPWGSWKVEAPKFKDSQHMKVCYDLTPIYCIVICFWEYSFSGMPFPWFSNVDFASIQMKGSWHNWRSLNQFTKRSERFRMASAQQRRVRTSGV